MNFIAELKRRGVLRVVAVYIVAAWAALQAADLIFPLLGFPVWSIRLALILLALGLPVAIALSWAFDFSRAGVRRDDPNTVTATRPLTRVVVLILALISLGLGAWYATSRVRGPLPDNNVVTIAPFRVSGAEPSLAYLREGLVDLLAAKLTGEGGPRSVDPRTVLAGWKQAAGDPNTDLTQEQALQLAASLGAGRLLLGELTGNPARLVLNASLVAAHNGQTVRATVQGPQDSLTALVDQLVAQLLVRESNEGEQRLASLTTTSLPALKAYLDGRTAYRRGAYGEALPLFLRALELDSTFALAALMAAETQSWNSDNTAMLGIAWLHRARLSRRDSLYLAASTGSRYPRPVHMLEALETLQRAAEAAPDRPETLFWYGDVLFHHGPRMARADWLDESERAFSRALELDSAFAAPIEHLIEVAVVRADTARVRQLGKLFFRRDSVSDFTDYVRWRVAASLNDRNALNALRSSFVGMTSPSLVRIALAMEISGQTADLRAVLNALSDRPSRPVDQLANSLTLMSMGTNHGWSALQQRGLSLIPPLFAGLADMNRVMIASGWSADTTGVGSALQRLRAVAASRRFAWLAETALHQWALFAGDTVDTPALVRKLASDSIGFPFKAEHAIVLDAIHAATTRRPDAAQAIAKFDSLMLRAPNALSPPEVRLARLYQMNGNPQRALEVVRRRGFHFLLSPMSLSMSYREEARLAAQVGDREGAIRAYQRYLAMRATAESPADRAELEQIKRELAALSTEVRR